LHAFKVATVTAAGAAVCLVIWNTAPSSPSSERRRWLAELRAARPYSARLADEPYAPMADHPLQVDVVIPAALRNAAEKGSSGALHDEGVAYLVLRDLNHALERLEQAAVLAPRDAEIQSDLAVAYLARARATGFYDALKAYRAASRAVQLSRALPEAWFNLALTLENLAMQAPAVRAWDEYLRIDGSSPWAVEAQTHHRALQSRGAERSWNDRFSSLVKQLAAGDTAGLHREVAADPQEMRRELEEEALPLWASLSVDGETSAAAGQLAVIRRLAAILAEVEGDRLLSESVAAIDHAVAEPAPSRRLALLRDGHRLYGEAVRLLRQSDKSADARFAEARDAFARARSPFGAWAILQLGAQACRSSRYREAEALLTPLVEGRVSYPALAGRALWILGLGRVLRGDLVGALAPYERAARLFQGMGELGNAAVLESLLGEDLRYLGEEEAASQHLARALSWLRHVHEPWLETVLSEAASAASAAGEPSAAFLFQDEYAATAASSGSPKTRVAALQERAQAEALLGDRARALADLDEARRTIERIAPEARGDLSADQMRFAGRIWRRFDPRRAVSLLSRGIEIYASEGTGLQVPGLRLERARALKDLGELAAAGADLRSALAVIERRLLHLQAPQERADYLAQERELFDEMVLLAARRGESEESFAVAELARAAALGRPGEDLAWQARASEQKIPDGVALIAYSLAGDRPWIWVVRREGMKLIEASGSTAELERAIARLRAVIGTAEVGDRAFDAAAGNIYQRLIRPAAEYLGGMHSLVFLPDGATYAVPFGALWDPDSSRFLVQRFAVSIAPSAAFYLRSLQQDRAQGSQPSPRALVVGNPEFRKDLFIELPSLPDAESEARQIAGLYRRVDVLLGPAATRRQLLALAGQSEVIHYAGHSLVDRKDPLRSGLVLAAQAGEDERGFLAAESLYRARFAHTRLVVLSACETAVGQVRGAEGMTSLAAPFLAAGVPAVVASLWRVEDREAADLQVSFHRHLLRGEDALTALRAVELENLHTLPPRVWAAFELIGGVRFYPAA
jgi:CHAT domain-containing protein